MAFTPSPFPTLYEDPRLVHFLINIFMMDYDLNPVPWVKSHIWIPWCERALIILVWGKLEIKGDLADLISQYVLQSFNTFCHADGRLHPSTLDHHNRHVTAMERSMVTQEEKTERATLMWWSSNDIASSLWVAVPIKCFTAQSGLEDNGISAHSRCQHKLKQCTKTMQTSNNPKLLFQRRKIYSEGQF